MRLVDIKKDFRRNKALYVLALPIMLYFIIFAYIPMVGNIMAFQRFSPAKGIFGSPWVGLDNFRDFFSSYYFVRLIRNTFLISVYDLIFGFPAPILLALLLNEVNNKYFKRSIQTITYMPHFLSLVVVAGIIINFTDSNGVITSIVAFFGGEKQNLLGRPENFRTIYVASGIWQNVGFGSIIFLAALSGINKELYEAAAIDGANKLKQTWYITLPTIASTIIVMLILRVGTIMAVGFEKIILLYSPATYETADVISSFIYRKGLQEFNYGYSTAVGMFNSIINFILLLFTNYLSRKFTETSLF